MPTTDSLDLALSSARHTSATMLDRALKAAGTTTEYGLVAEVASQQVGGSTAGIGRAVSLQQHQEQYRHFMGLVFACCRVIAQRIARQPLRVARVQRYESYPDQDRSIAMSRRVRAARARHRAWLNNPDKKTLPTCYKTFHQDLDVLENHPLLDCIQKPNEVMVRWMLMYTTQVSLDLTSKAYWWVYDAPRNSPFYGRKVIWPVPSHWIDPIHTETQLYAGWKIRPEGSLEEKEVPADEIVYFYYPDPSNPLGAISPLQALSRYVVADEAIAEAQRRGFANGIWPGLAIIVGRHPESASPGLPQQRPALTKEQRAQLIVAVKQAYRGVAHYDEPIILDSIIQDVKKVSNTNREMDFLNSAKHTMQRIYLGYGVNPIVMGEIEGANRASAAVADDNFVSNTVNPRIELLSEIMTATLVPHFDDSPAIIAYIEEAQATDPDTLRQDRDQLIKAGALANNELRQEMGRPPIHGGDICYVAQALVPVNVVREEDEEPDGPALKPGESPEDQEGQQPDQGQADESLLFGGDDEDNQQGAQGNARGMIPVPVGGRLVWPGAASLTTLAASLGPAGVNDFWTSATAKAVEKLTYDLGDATHALRSRVEVAARDALNGGTLPDPSMMDALDATSEAARLCNAAMNACRQTALASAVAEWELNAPGGSKGPAGGLPKSAPKVVEAWLARLPSDTSWFDAVYAVAGAARTSLAESASRGDSGPAAADAVARAVATHPHTNPADHLASYAVGIGRTAAQTSLAALGLHDIAARCGGQGGKPGPCPSGQHDHDHQDDNTPHGSDSLHAAALKAAKGLLTKFTSALDKVTDARGLKQIKGLANKAKALTSTVYKGMESRYGKAAAVGIMGAGTALSLSPLPGMPINPLAAIPGSALIGAIPFAAVAEGYLQLRRGAGAISSRFSGRRDADAGDDGKPAEGGSGAGSGEPLDDKTLKKVGAALVRHVARRFFAYCDANKESIEEALSGVQDDSGGTKPAKPDPDADRSPRGLLRAARNAQLVIKRRGGNIEWRKPNLDRPKAKNDLKRAARGLGRRGHTIDADGLKEALEGGKLTKLTPAIWSKIVNTTSNKVSKLVDIIRYVHKKRKKLHGVLEEYLLDKVRAPLVVKMPSGKYFLVDGNTRLMVARVFDIKPRVWLAELTAPDKGAGAPPPFKGAAENVSAAPSRTDADLAVELPLVAEILLAVLGEDAINLYPPAPTRDVLMEWWASLPRLEERVYEPCRDDRGRFAPCGGGGFTTAERAERSRSRVQEAQTMLDLINDYHSIIDDHRRFGERLLAMTRDELTKFQSDNGLHAEGNAKLLKAELVKRFAEHVRSQRPPSPDTISEGEPFLSHLPMDERLARYHLGDKIVEAVVAHGDKIAKKLESAQKTKDAISREHDDHINNVLQPLLNRQEEHANAGRHADAVAMNPEITQACAKMDEINSRFRAVIDKIGNLQGGDAVKELIRQLKPADKSLAVKFHVDDHANLTPVQAQRGQEAAKFAASVATRCRQDPALPRCNHQTVNKSADPEARAHYSGPDHGYDQHAIHTEWNDTSNVAVHELGHFLEHVLPGANFACRQFLNYRVGQESPTPMKEVCPSCGYKDREQGRKDNFDKAFDRESAYYVGKKYDKSTEILSMGLEKMHQDPAGFAKKDPEYFKFVVGVLKGHLRW